MYPAYTPVHDPTAVMGKRFGAYLIDFAILFVIAMALFLVFVERRDFGSSFAADQFCDQLNATDEFICGAGDTMALYVTAEQSLIVLGVGFGAWFLNDAVLTGLVGGSIGKLSVGLRVVRQSDGHHAGFWRSIGRWAMWIADAAPWCFPLVGLIVALSTKGHRRVGDLVCGTLVINKSEVGTAPVVPGLNMPMGQYGYPPPGGYGPPPYGSPGGQPGPWGPPPSQPTPPGNPWGPPQGQQPPTGWNTPGPVAPPTWGPPAAPGQPPPAPPRPDAPVSWEPPPGRSPTYPPMPTPSGPQEDPTTVQPVVTGGEPTSTMPAAAPQAGGPGVDAPLWDDARDTYIQWDPDINRWVEWDEPNRTWHPI